MDNHVTHFARLLQERISSLDIRNFGEKVSELFNLNGDTLISESTDSNNFYQSLLNAALKK